MQQTLPLVCFVVGLEICVRMVVERQTTRAIGCPIALLCANIELQLVQALFECMQLFMYRSRTLVGNDWTSSSICITSSPASSASASACRNAERRVSADILVKSTARRASIDFCSCAKSDAYDSNKSVMVAATQPWRVVGATVGWGVAIGRSQGRRRHARSVLDVRMTR